MESTNRTVMAHRDYWVNTEEKELFQELISILGEENVKVS